MVTLDIISDPICPWCLIGKTRLEAAIAEVGQNPFVTRWRMFRLNPDMAPEGMDRRAYLEAKFGGPEGAAEVYGQIARVAEDAGLDLALDRIERTPQTLDAHRLMRFAAAEGRSGTVADALFDRYFRKGQDISDRAVLLEVAGETGFDPAVADRLLDGDAERATLEAEEAEAREMGVTGVPSFLIAGRHMIEGAQDSATWVGIIREINAALAEIDAREGGPEAPDP